LTDTFERRQSGVARERQASRAPEEPRAE